MRHVSPGRAQRLDQPFALAQGMARPHRVDALRALGEHIQHQRAADHRMWREYDRSTDHVLELPNVARPVAVGEELHRPGREAGALPTDRSPDPRAQIRDEDRKVRAALAKRRHADREAHEEALQLGVEVGRDGVDRCRVRSRGEPSHPASRRLALLGPEAIEPPRLGRARKALDVSEVHRRAEGNSSLGREGRRIGADQMAARSRSERVQQARDGGAATSRLAGQKHRYRERSHALDPLAKLP
jgi:hypothetical protein